MPVPTQDTDTGTIPPATTDARGHPDWARVEIIALDTLTLSAAHPHTRIPVSVINRSDQPLDPQLGEGLVLAVSAWDAEDRRLATECVRTELERPVPAGGELHQWMTISIPRDEFPTIKTLRAGLLVQGQYWVEQAAPEHPAKIALREGQPLSVPQLEQASAEHLWPQGNSNPLRWPYHTMMVAPAQQLFYVPIAKCACTSLKTLMVQLAGIDHVERVGQLAVHWVCDRFNTGAQLKDLPMDRARAILAAEDYFKFAVVRAPLERVVSAYLEKFVYKRRDTRNRLHTRPVLASIQGSDDIDIETGVSFARFVDYLLTQSPYDLDTHWRPQYLYLKGVPHLTHLYPLQALSVLQRDLEAHLGFAVELEHKNRTEKSSLWLEGAAHKLPGELEAAGHIDPGCLLDGDIQARLSSYYSEDFALYQRALDAVGGDMSQ